MDKDTKLNQAKKVVVTGGAGFISNAI